MDPASLRDPSYALCPLVPFFWAHYPNPLAVDACPFAASGLLQGVTRAGALPDLLDLSPQLCLPQTL